MILWNELVQGCSSSRAKDGVIPSQKKFFKNIFCPCIWPANVAVWWTIKGFHKQIIDKFILDIMTMKGVSGWSAKYYVFQYQMTNSLANKTTEVKELNYLPLAVPILCLANHVQYLLACLLEQASFCHESKAGLSLAQVSLQFGSFVGALGALRHYFLNFVNTPSLASVGL